MRLRHFEIGVLRDRRIFTRLEIEDRGLQYHAFSVGVQYLRSGLQCHALAYTEPIFCRK